MNIVIVGAGTVGFHIATQLIDENKNVVLIEKDQERAKFAATHLDCLVLNDSGNDIEVLKQAGIKSADFFISVADSDEVNMIACGLVSSEFNVPFKVARVRNLAYSRSKLLERPFLGIDYVVTPEVEAAKVITQSVTKGAVSDVIIFENTDIQMRNYFVDDKSFFLNKSLKEIKHSINEDFLISGISRKEDMIIPSGDTVVTENDKLYLVATQKNMERVFSKTGKPTLAIKSIIIVGGGRIGNLVANSLKKADMSFKIIENCYETCRDLADKFPEALVINADISDEGIFEEEQLGKNDVIITTTDNQELNMLAAIYAKSQGVKRSIALVSKSNYLTIASELGIDAIVSPKNSTADSVLKIIRGRNIQSVHSIFDGRAEVIEFIVSSKSSLLGIPLKEIKLPPNSLMLSVTRNNVNHIPDGNFSLNEKDNVLIIAMKSSIPQIEEMFIK